MSRPAKVGNAPQVGNRFKNPRTPNHKNSKREMKSAAGQAGTLDVTPESMLAVTCAVTCAESPGRKNERKFGVMSGDRIERKLFARKVGLYEGVRRVGPLRFLHRRRTTMMDTPWTIVGLRTILVTWTRPNAVQFPRGVVWLITSWIEI